MTDRKFTRRNALGLLAGASTIAITLVSNAKAGISLQDFGRQIGSLPEITVYTARRVITMENNEPGIDAVAVVGERVLAAGPRDELIDRIGQQPYRLDTRFDEKVIMAGLIDQHVHPFLAALTLTAEVIAIEDWDLPTGLSKAAISSEDYRTRLEAAEAALEEPDTPLISWGYHHFWHGEVRRPQLDEISATRPILVIHRSYHEVILNTPALEQLGISEATVSGFDAVAREQTRFDLGHFYEAGLFSILPKIAPMIATPERLTAGLRLARDYMHRAGVTMGCEPGGVLSKPLQDAVNAEFSGPDTPFRSFFIPDGKSLAAAYLADGSMISETEKLLDWGEGKTRFLPKQVKLFADGAVYSLAMQMTEPYVGGDFHGEWIMDPDFFDRTFDAYWESGYQVHIHQSGDLGLDMILDAVERNMRRMPRPDHRTTIVHFGYARKDQCDRIANLGCIVSGNPYYVTALSDRYSDIGLGPERADDLVPLGYVKANATPISFHSDMPMAPGQPLFLVWAAVNRTTTSGRVAGAEHRLSVEDALKAVTIDAAQSLRMETELGSIAPGKYANFTILEEDPFEVEAGAIKDIGVWGTVLEGRVFPVSEAVAIDKASLFSPGNAAQKEALFSRSEAASVVKRGLLAGCSCCTAPTAFSCSPSPTAAASGAACCGTNALGWAVVAEWALG